MAGCAGIKVALNGFAADAKLRFHASVAVRFGSPAVYSVNCDDMVQAVVRSVSVHRRCRIFGSDGRECIFTDILYPLEMQFLRLFPQNLRQRRQNVSKRLSRDASVGPVFAVLAYIMVKHCIPGVLIYSIGKDGTAWRIRYQDYMRWLGYCTIFVVKMATDGVLTIGLGIMRPFLAANIVNLAILSIALIYMCVSVLHFMQLCCTKPVLACQFPDFYVALQKIWPAE